MQLVTLDDLQGLVSTGDLTLREIMTRISASAPRFNVKFQVIIDAAGRLVGTMTDGDIRRALLRGANLTDPAQAWVNAKATSVRLGDERALDNKLKALGRGIGFIPVVDADRVLRQIVIAEQKPGPEVTALVMAGGFGTRLGERTRDTPKPLLPVGGTPILEQILRRLEADGIHDIYVSVHYLADQIVSFLANRAGPARCTPVHEEAPMGTAGALGRLPTGLARPIIVINGDLVTALDFGALVAFHARRRLDGTIAVVQHELQIPFGVIQHDESGAFLGIHEKPKINNFVAAGVYLLSPEFQALVRPNQPMDMPELLNAGRRVGLGIGLFPIHEYWTDVGRPDDLARANDVAGGANGR